MSDQRLQELLAELKAAAIQGPASVKAWHAALSDDDRQLFDQAMRQRVQAFIEQTFVIVAIDVRYWQRREYAEIGFPYGDTPVGCLLWIQHLEWGIAPRHYLDEADIYVSLDELMTGWQPLWERGK